MKLMPVLRLVRIEHSLMLIVAVVAAELLSGSMPGLPVLALSIITPIFVGASAFSINDYFDVNVDRKNKKRRPIVEGELTRSDALRVTAGSMIIGIFAAFLINLYCGAIATGFALLSLLYSYRLKVLPVAGNAYVALAMAIPFIFGSYVVSQSPDTAVLLIFLLIFMAGMAREIDGTVRDYSGDVSARGAKTLPVLIGRKASSAVAFALYAAAVAISIYLFGYVKPLQGNLVYALPAALTDILLLYSGYAFLAGKERLYGLVRNMSLAGMAIALMCILAAAIAYIRIPF